MDISSGINILLLLSPVIVSTTAWRATFASRKAAQELHDIQKRLLETEEKREQDRIASLRPVELELSYKNYDSGLFEIKL